jgi:hypothetical protein
MHGEWQLFSPTLLVEVEGRLLIRWLLYIRLQVCGGELCNTPGVTVFATVGTNFKEFQISSLFQDFLSSSICHLYWNFKFSNTSQPV